MQVAQVHEPPHSATMPGTLWASAVSMTVLPSVASTVCSVPSCSMKVIFGIAAAACLLGRGSTSLVGKLIFLDRRRQRRDQGRHRDLLSLLDGELGHPPGRWRMQHVLHLHGFHHGNAVALLHGIAFAHEELCHPADD